MAKSKATEIVAAALALALPAAFYTFGDLVDGFPGPLTLRTQKVADLEGVPAEGEAWEREDLVRPRDAASPVERVSGEHITAAVEALPGLGAYSGKLSYAVVDAASGEMIAERDASVSLTPASTMKLLSALAAAKAVGPEQTLTTRTVLDGERLVLVGGGDNLLTVKPKETKEGIARASLASLADQTVQKLKAEGRTKVTLVFDDTLFGNDPVNPAWGENGPAGGWVAPITPLGIDAGRADGTKYGAKSKDPSYDAAKAFAELLKERGITIEAEPTRGAAPEGATELGSVQSAPLSSWIAHTLLYSDNTLAETLARLAAVKTGRPGTVAGAREAVKAELDEVAREKGFSTEGLVIADNSGLSKDNRLSPSLLAHLTAWASGNAPVEIRDTFARVPIGGLTGTLKNRFGEAGAEEARGVARGKTGTLSGTSTLAGTTVLSDGRVVGYAIFAYDSQADGYAEARALVDDVASAIISAGGPTPAGLYDAPSSPAEAGAEEGEEQ